MLQQLCKEELDFIKSKFYSYKTKQLTQYHPGKLEKLALLLCDCRWRNRLSCWLNQSRRKRKPQKSTKRQSFNGLSWKSANCPLTGRHFLQEKTPNSRGVSHHIRKIPPYLDETSRTQSSKIFLFLHGLSASEVELYTNSNWRHGLLWRMKNRRKIGQNSSKIIDLFPSIRTGGSQNHKQSLMFHSVFCSSLRSGFLYLQLP